LFIKETGDAVGVAAMDELFEDAVFVGFDEPFGETLLGDFVDEAFFSADVTLGLDEEFDETFLFADVVDGIFAAVSRLGDCRRCPFAASPATLTSATTQNIKFKLWFADNVNLFKFIILLKS
jgi:hypothetical protein